MQGPRYESPTAQPLTPLPCASARLRMSGPAAKGIETRAHTPGHPRRSLPPGIPTQISSADDRSRRRASPDVCWPPMWKLFVAAPFAARRTLTKGRQESHLRSSARRSNALILLGTGRIECVIGDRIPMIHKPLHLIACQTPPWQAHHLAQIRAARTADRYTRCEPNNSGRDQ